MSGESRTVFSLALLYAFRMLGLFMVLPVLVIYGDKYSGATPALLGLALGVYGLMQALLQIPLGLLSDFWGRKNVIVAGMLIFALGSAIAAFSSSIEGLIIGRAMQGMGAIASVIMALVADLTSEQNRSKAMATIGASIGVSFALAIVIGPALAGAAGLPGIFVFSVALSLLGIFITIFIVPNPTVINIGHREVSTIPAMLISICHDRNILRLNGGIFCLHFTLMASFIAIPQLLSNTLGIAAAKHWQIYLPILLLSFIAMLPLMLVAEKRQQIKAVFLAAIATMILAMTALTIIPSSMVSVFGLIFVFFVAFNLLEATLPSLVSKLAPAGTKGTAMGIYSSCQFLGAFAGGTVGGILMHYYGDISTVFAACALVCTVWMSCAYFMAKPRHLHNITASIPSHFSNSDALLALSGVEDVYLVKEQNLAYLKVDRTQFENAQLQKLLGDSK